MCVGLPVISDARAPSPVRRRPLSSQPAKVQGLGPAADWRRLVAFERSGTGKSPGDLVILAEQEATRVEDAGSEYTRASALRAAGGRVADRRGPQAHPTAAGAGRAAGR